MSDSNALCSDSASASASAKGISDKATKTTTPAITSATTATANPSETRTLKAPSNFGSISKIGRLCQHVAPKAGPPPRDETKMMRDTDDNFNSLNSTYTDLYQETVRNFTRSSLSPEVESFSISKFSTKSFTPEPVRRTSFDFYQEATGRRRSSDHGAVLTVDTEQFIIGQKVWVGGVRSGQIAYIGETHFAPGEWAGIVLDEPNGKNDGCVAGKRYFQCEPKKGIFSRLTRLTLSPLANVSPKSKLSPERSRTVSPTASIRSSFYRSPGKNGLTVGDRVIVSSGFGSRAGILRYLGETKFAPGNWCGVELDEPSGKNDGSVDDFRYFECQPKYGVFVPIAKVSLSPSSKKSRLSRSGSRESLTSVGTMNSIATTNTSRLRMSSQRKQLESSPTKPAGTAKSQFSMQDLIREKQNHIEQLMIERDLDREDAQNQALQFQKNISELKGRIVDLERKLNDEQKKTEDLQFSIDEATFCGDEFNLQAQVYREKISELEVKLKQTESAPSSDESAIVSAIASATEVANHQVHDLSVKLTQQGNEYEAKIESLLEEQKNLLENYKYLEKENEIVKKELLDKDEHLERYSLSESGIENLRCEMKLLKEESEREKLQLNAENTEKIGLKTEEIKQMTAELTELKNSLNTANCDRSNIEDECEILKNECKSRDKQIKETTKLLTEVTEALQFQKTETADLTRTLQTQKSECVERSKEVTKLNDEILTMAKAKATVESKLEKILLELKTASEGNSSLNQLLLASKTDSEEKNLKIVQLQTLIDNFQKRITDGSAENQKLLLDIAAGTEEKLKLQKSEETLRTELKDKNDHLNDESTKNKDNLAIVESLRHEIISLKSKSDSKSREIEKLNNQVASLLDKTKVLEEGSSSTAYLMKTKVDDLESKLQQTQITLQQERNLMDELNKKCSNQQDTIIEKDSLLAKLEHGVQTAGLHLAKTLEERNSLQTNFSNLEEVLKRKEDTAAAQELEIGDVSRKLEAESAKCNSLLAQNNALQQDLLAARATASDRNEAFNKITDEITANQKAFDDLQNVSSLERIRLEAQLQEANQKLLATVKGSDELKSHLAKHTQELFSKTELFASLEQKSIAQELALKDASRKNESLQAKFDTLLAQNESLQMTLDSLRSSSTDSNTEVLKLTQELNSKQKSFDELLDKTTTERMQLENDLEESKQRLVSLSTQVEAQNQQLTAMAKEAKERDDLLKETEETSAKRELDFCDSSRNLKMITEKCHNLTNQNENLQKDLSSLRTSSSETQNKIMKLAAELSKKQEAYQELSDASNSERIELQNKLQESLQRLVSTQVDLESAHVEIAAIREETKNQNTEFEVLKKQMEARAQQEIEKILSKVATEKTSIQQSFESQLKNAEKSKITLVEAITSLQNQMELLQEELLQSQLSFKSKEEELETRISGLIKENDNMQNSLEKLRKEGTSSLQRVQQEHAVFVDSSQNLRNELEMKSKALSNAEIAVEKLQLDLSKANAQLIERFAQIKSLETQLEATKSQLSHEVSICDDYKLKMETLRNSIAALQTSNANMSATNAELSATLDAIEAEKCETTNNFELFELEADKNVATLKEKLEQLEEKYNQTISSLSVKDSSIAQLKQRVEQLLVELNSFKSSLIDANLKIEEKVVQIADLTNTKCDLEKVAIEKENAIRQLTSNLSEKNTSVEQKSLEIAELQEKLSQLTKLVPTAEEITKSGELHAQLSEYKTIVEELDDLSTAKNTKLTELEQYVKVLEQEKHSVVIEKKTLELNHTTLQRKLEMLELERKRELAQLQLQPTIKQKQNGAGDAFAVEEEVEDSSAQISFLNSIIADMQKKNDTLKAKIDALEALPSDYTKPYAFDFLKKRKPAPRKFCDICDEFDQHETEDCPLQSSDADTSYSDNKIPPTHERERKLPTPRKYCESCEVFGHEAGECNDDESY